MQHIVFGIACASFVWIVVTAVMFGTGRISYLSTTAQMAGANFINMLASAFRGSTLLAALNAASMVAMLWMWWTGGGGDKTRHRMRFFMAKFQPVRRTAPRAP